MLTKEEIEGFLDRLAADGASYDEIEPGYHLNKRHWLTVTCGGEATDELVRELVAGSYDLVSGAARR